jgi:L,D-transpeptidase catalytic domain
VTHVRPRVRRTLAVALLVAAGAGLPACSGGDGVSAAPAAATAAAGISTAAASAAQEAPFPRRAFTTSADPLVVRHSARSDASVVTRLTPRTPLGSPRVLLALAARSGWVQVALPTRPNGSTGWVRAADLRLEPVGARVEVDLAARRLRVLDGTRVLVDTTVAVGSSANPTPRGAFYVTDRVRPPDPHGAYGSFALGLSAHSPTLTEFEGSDGQVAVHGTNDPASIGRAVSHGCVRVPDAVAAQLAALPLGTPVTIR